MSVGIFHLDRPRKFSQRLRHIISKQEYSLRRLPETAEELVDILKQTWKVTRSAQCLHIPMTISTLYRLRNRFRQIGFSSILLSTDINFLVIYRLIFPA